MERDSFSNNKICVFKLCTSTKLQQLSPLILHDPLNIHALSFIMNLVPNKISWVLKDLQQKHSIDCIINDTSFWEICKFLVLNALVADTQTCFYFYDNIHMNIYILYIHMNVI